jgi:excisionase family DNA binding protein
MKAGQTREQTMENERLLTVQEVSDRLRVHPDTLRRWLRGGRIRGVMMGGRSGGYRIKESEVARVESEGVGEHEVKRAA